IKSVVLEGDTKLSLSIKLGCTVNVLDKFLWRKCGISWLSLRDEMGFLKSSHSNSGRPKGSNRKDLTFQQICSAYEKDITCSLLAKKLGVTKNDVISRLSQNGFNKFSDFSNNFNNHKVVSIEYYGVIPLYDFTVDGYKNFATDTVISHNTPELAAALDIYADETVAQDDKGRALHIYSDNEKIKQILEDLFYDTLNVEFNLRSWARNLVKYGDFFMYNDVSPEHGVINAFPIPVNEIEREENYDPNDPMAVRYRWVTLGNRTLENWEVTHFRLLGNDMFLPYGSSVIEPARRIWRQLILIEDAMLVYRVVRAPERRVFYIDVANIPPENVPMYVEEQRKNLRSSQVIDRNTSRVDLRYNPMSVDEDFFIPVRGGDSGTRIDTLAGGQNTAAVEDVAYIQKKLFAALKIPRAYLGYDESLCLLGSNRIPLLDGRNISVEELVREFTTEPNKKLYVYSSGDDGAIKPGKVINAWKTKEVKEFYRVGLDTGGYIDCTDNHPFLCRDGIYRRADELEIGQSLMPLYRKLSQGKKFGGEDLVDGYEMVLDNSSGEWKYTHKVVNDSSGIHTVYKQRVVHHVDFNKYNNNPENLIEMTWHDHRRLHSRHLETTLLRPDVIEKAKKGVLKWIDSPRHREFKSEMMRLATTTPGNTHYERIHSSAHSTKMSEVMKENWNNPEYRTLKSKQNKEHWNLPEYRKKYMNDNHWIRRKNSSFTIEALREFCIKHEVSSINQWRKDNPFSVADLSPVGIRYVKSLIRRSGYSSWRDFARKELGLVVPKRGPDPKNHKITSIEVIKLDAPIPVYDIEVEGWHNFAVGSDRIVELQRGVSCCDDYVFVHNSSKATLAQEDIRFSRTISVIQKTIIAELNKLAIIHL
ncbi:hypothetical protein FJZ55_06615, partial [Candidatus Woesearchaeota archaeon]|nr:hypothetical protein [Candidatus Woesearchaeota archaeon]